MLRVAQQLNRDKVSFIQAYSHETNLPEESADIVVCSQSFHWMEPASTLSEVHRILKPDGIFATIDYDWPPVSHWRISHDAYVVDSLKKMLSFLAPVEVMAGEFEMEALASGAVRVLEGKEAAKINTGEPVWSGFQTS